MRYPAGNKRSAGRHVHPHKTYLFFHIPKLQPYNRKLQKAVIEKNITLIDYNTSNMKMEKDHRFWIFAGIVGAHNGMMAYGKNWRI